MQTEKWHGDVLAGISSYDELDHELKDTDLSAYRQAPKYDMPDYGDPGCAWSADEGEEFARPYLERLREVADRPDADVHRNVLRALLCDSLVPVTVDVQVCEGVVTLTGTVAVARERDDAKYLAGVVPGVFGVIDDLTCWPQLGADDEHTTEDDVTRQSVAAAFRRTGSPEITELTIEEPRPRTVVLSGAVHSRTDHELAIAAAWSVASVQAVDDCIDCIDVGSIDVGS